MEKKQSDFLRDISEPGWREREAERDAALFAAVPIQERKPMWQPKRPERCHAGSDGDCTHGSCPQLRDSEPAATGRHCPLDADDSER